MNKVFFTFVVLIFTCGVLLSQENPEVKSKKIADNLYLINAAGVNSLILTGSDGTLLVDDNTESAAPFLMKEINKVTNDSMKFIVNTHWHFDHTEGNLIFGKGKTIIAHEEVKKLLSKDETLLGELHKAYPEYALPNITFSDKYEQKLNGESVVITSLSSGHSAGDVIVYFKNADVLHIGDIVFADMFPFVDTDHGGNVLTLMSNIKTIISIVSANTRIIPGHGRVLTIEDLKKYHNMILNTVGIVKTQIENKKSLDEIKASKILDAFAEWQVAFSINDWIEFIYLSLRQK